MRTIETTLYNYNELSPEAQERAREWYRCDCMDPNFGDLRYESNESRKSFLDEFNAEFRRGSYGSENVHINRAYNWYGNAISELSYVRLWKYLHANHSDCISKIGDCQFTGVCWDEFLLDGIAEFVRKPYKTDFESLLYSCCEDLRVAVENEIEYQNSDEAIAESIIANGYEFTHQGEIA